METTIQLEKSLKDELNKLKVHPRESFNSVIERLIKNYIDSDPLSEAEIKDIEKSLNDIKEGKVYTLAEVKKQLGIK